jgi:5-methyltetrahydrofolate--homocysteine methyltransferase
MPNESSLMEQLNSNKVLVFDGGTGTMIQAALAKPENSVLQFDCYEQLNLLAPNIISQIHKKYISAGARVITTNTFGANEVTLSEHGLEHKTTELAKAGAQLARIAADECREVNGENCWVLGDLGPGTKLPTLNQITYQELKESYYQASVGLIQGGADAIIVETVQDILQAKAAVNGAKLAFKNLNKRLPIFVSITIEDNGTTLLGSDIVAAAAAILPLGIDAIGLNCAAGPADLEPHLAKLAEITNLPVFCQPNAGKPTTGGAYDLGAKEFARVQADFVRNYGISGVGGCCGTTPEYIGELVSNLADVTKVDADV